MIRDMFLSLVLAHVAVSLAGAQEVVWSLTPDDVAVYEREQHWDPEALDGKRSVSWGGHVDHVPPILAGSSLDAARMRRARPVQDLYDLYPHLAFDLTTWKAGRVDVVFRRLPWFGDVHVTGRAAAPDSQGNQTLRLKVRSLREMDTSDVTEEFAKSLRWYFDERIDGELTLERSFDATRGLITGFRAELDAKFVDTNEGKGEERRFGMTGSEVWTLESIAKSDGEFRERVNEAMDRGVAYVLKRLAEHEDSTLIQGEGRGNVQGPTFHAIELFALARAGVSFKDPVVAASLERFAGREFSHTNTLALGVLAVDALYASPTERAAIVAGEASGQPERRLPARERGWIADWTGRILSNLDAEAWADGYAVWWFVADGFEDTGTTWLALQALDAAERCGVKVPAELWPSAARWLVDTQRPSGLLVTESVQFLRGGRNHGEVEAAGWSDHANAGWEHSHGAPTAEALAGLALCRSRLVAAGDQSELAARVDAAIHGGMAWLARDFTTYYDPAPHPVYYQNGDDLRFALPFALENLGVIRVAGIDWYLDGANALMALQEERGSMGDCCFGTAAGLVFLRRTSKGPVTGWRDR